MGLMKIMAITQLVTLCTLQGYVLVYDISDRESFNGMFCWKKHLHCVKSHYDDLTLLCSFSHALNTLYTHIPVPHSIVFWPAVSP